MNESDTVQAVIRDKLAHGELRGETPETVWGGKGTGQSCSGCNRPIAGNDMEYEVDYPGARAVMRFDQTCLFIWDDYRTDYPTSVGVA
jgi:hypothetical protein